MGKGFQVMVFVDETSSTDVLAKLNALQASNASGPVGAQNQTLKARPLLVTASPLVMPGMNAIVDTQGLVAKRYDARPGTTYLLRPDQHVVARWRQLDLAQLQTAMARALGSQIGQA
jgi:3-(3-hydroxy-phenyl)propionate hydroxylase